jgi:hypothetical protein
VRYVPVLVLLVTCLSLHAGELADLHERLPKDERAISRNSRDHKEVDTETTEISEIGLERTPCYGSCPVYTVIIKADGNFRYHGEHYVERKGDHTGKVSVREFNDLAQFIIDTGYMNLDHTYYRAITDQATVYTTVVMNGKRQLISNYANAGPPKLWAVEQLIDKLLLESQWDHEPERPRPSR